VFALRAKPIVVEMEARSATAKEGRPLLGKALEVSWAPRAALAEVAELCQGLV